MNRTSVFAFVALVGMVVAVGGVNAQTSEENVELEQARLELQEARQALESAAREVARLSSRVAGPILGDVTRQFRMTGRRAMLGINISDTEDGVRVDGVTPGGPAAESGIVTGDVIVAMDGATLTGESPSELLIAQMGNVNPGDAVALTLLRDGDEQDVEVITREIAPLMFGHAGPGGPNLTLRGVPLPGSNFAMPTFDVLRRAGRWRDMELVELTPELGGYFGTETGILVVRAPTDVPELQDGDVILEIGARTPNSTEHAMRILGSFEPGETLELAIMRNQRRQTLEIELPPSAQQG